MKNTVKNTLLIANHALLFLCASMYLGTGVSLVWFSFPVEPQMTPDNYYLQFVPQVQAATVFFTLVVKIMLTCGVIMLISEWRQRTVWVPVVVLAAVSAASALTVYWIFPLNNEMANHITDAARLKAVLGEWMNYSRWRMGLWTIEWAAMMWYFGYWAYRARYAPLGR
jgi:hypothetical protein